MLSMVYPTRRSSEPDGCLESPDVTVLRVFTDEDARFGNALGIVAEPGDMQRAERQRLATELGYSETVFIDDRDEGRVQIFTPADELAFAGHPLVGTSWFLTRQGWTGSSLRPPAGIVETWQDDDLTWISADPAWAPQETVEQLDDVDAVDALSLADCEGSDLYAWAWMNQASGLVRARYFAPGFGIDEDEATGSAAVLLGSIVARDITIQQGKGSKLYVRTQPDGRVAVGGRVGEAPS